MGRFTGYGILIGSLALAFLVAPGAGAGSGHKRGMETYVKTLEGRLRALPDQPSPAEDALIDETANLGLPASRVLVSVWLGSDSVLSRRARSILNGLEGKALPVLLEASLPRNAVDRQWLIYMIRDYGRQSRQKKEIAAKLELLLADRMRIQGPEIPGPLPEERTPDRRVCDEALLAARRLAYGLRALPLEDHLIFERSFLQLNEAEKDREIGRLRRSSGWKALAAGK